MVGMMRGGQAWPTDDGWGWRDKEEALLLDSRPRPKILAGLPRRNRWRDAERKAAG
jgi:hypothetical protein